MAGTTLRDKTDQQVAMLTDAELEDRMTLAHEKRQRFQRGTSRGARRYDAMWYQALAEKERRGL